VDNQGGSGCAKTIYAIDGSAYKTYGAPLSLPLKGKKKSVLKFLSEDKAGNRGAALTEIYQLESIAPKTTAKPRGGTYKAAQSVTLECADNQGGSGCDKIFYSTDGSSPAKRYTSPITLPVKGKKKTVLDFYSQDKAGNREKTKTEKYTLKDSPKVTATDGSFIAYENGTVLDTKTGLEWYAGPDKDTDWNHAKSWVESLSVDGRGWRMPSRKELAALYKKGAGTRNMTPLLKTTGWLVWTGETEGPSSAWLFYFNHGLATWIPRFNPNEIRGFAVRSRR